MPRAQAVIYDDNMMNLAGVVPRGKIPPIRTVHCTQPLTVAQLEEALAMSIDAAAAAEIVDDGDEQAPPALFLFFDFDMTLSLQSGVETSVSSDPADQAGILVRLFGTEARQAALARLLAHLLAKGRCYILTANNGYVMVAHLLNLLLVRAAHHGFVPTMGFVPDQTVHLTPTGSKIRAITRLLEARGFRLAAVYD